MAQAFLNRATATSFSDSKFTDEARRLATDNPLDFLHAALTSSSLDVRQVGLVHQLLCHLPDLVTVKAPGSQQAALIIWLRRAMHTNGNLPSVRQKALLLLMSHLVASTATPGIGLDIKQTRAHVSPETHAGSEPNGPPLMNHSALLCAVLVPLLRLDAYSSSRCLSLVLQGSLNVVSSCAVNMVTHHSRVEPQALLALVSALFELLAQVACSNPRIQLTTIPCRYKCQATR